jgi:hypothetical protein
MPIGWQAASTASGHCSIGFHSAKRDAMWSCLLFLTGPAVVARRATIASAITDVKWSFL